MGQATVGLIMAALDVDVDNGAAWNRWYDLEHLAPNLAMPGLVAGHRYVAPPALHRSRRTAARDPAWGAGRGVYLTWYATSVDPEIAITAMSARRDELEAQGRMERAGTRVVRLGDALELVEARADPDLRLETEELIHVGHAGLRLILEMTARAPSTPLSVIGALRFASRFQPGLFAELQLLDRPAATVIDELQESDPRPGATLDAGFDPIVPLHHPFLDTIEASDLPRTVTGH